MSLKALEAERRESRELGPVSPVQLLVKVVQLKRKDRKQQGYDKQGLGSTFGSTFHEVVSRFYEPTNPILDGAGH